MVVRGLSVCWGSSELSACYILLMLHVSTGAGEVAAVARGFTHIIITPQFLLYLCLPLSLTVTHCFYVIRIIPKTSINSEYFLRHQQPLCLYSGGEECCL